MIFSRYMTDVGYLLFYTIVVFVILILINRKKIINIFDPFLIQTVIITFAIAGLIIIGHTFFNFNYKFFIMLLTFMFLVGAFIGNIRKKNILLNLNIPKELQLIYLVTLLLISILDLTINLLMSGKIPLFMEYSADMRIAATENSRVLFYLGSSVGFIPIVFLALSQSKKVKILAFILLLLGIFKTILMASKAFLLHIVILYAIYYFLKSLQFSNDVSYVGIKERKKINSAKYKLVIFTLIAFALIPVYMFYRGRGLDIAIIFARLYHGFDNLMFTIVYDLKIDDIFQNYNIGMIDLYFMPFIKALFGIKYQYNSASEYILEQSLGITQKQALPNSNLMLELVMTNGYLIAFIGVILIYSIILYCRKKMILSKKLNLLKTLLLYYTVTGPFNLILFGYQEFLRILLGFLIALFVIFIYSILPKKRKVHEKVKYYRRLKNIES